MGKNLLVPGKQGTRDLRKLREQYSLLGESDQINFDPLQGEHGQVPNSSTQVSSDQGKQPYQ
jgi:hypothetical protein